MPQQFHPPHRSPFPRMPEGFLAAAGQPAAGTAEVRPNHDGQSEPAKLLLMVGLPGAGKTTRAEELAAAHGALRLTPDEWMISLFDGAQPDGKRDVLEGRLIALALQALRLGTSVVLDFGFWSRDERSALRRLATSAGAACQVIYLPIDEDVQRARIAHRQATAPHATFPMSEADLGEWRKQFQAPDAAELGGGDIPGPPAGWLGWPEWAADRWPSLAHGSVSEARRRHRPAPE
ncbi:ATP-binding protein [Nonomuraea pusilla]|uniref:AAA family ATPase n=1 Tax=Nonomuraea pusilla TaxID=46177 RepID=UPI003328CC2D